MMYLVPLNKELKASEVGGKAAGLSKLISHGVKVPGGFAVRKEALHQYTTRQVLPEDFTKELEESAKTLNGNQLIVRSSGIGEDSESYSFAGQLDSFVVTHDLQAIQSAIIKCWSGLNNGRFLAYQTFSGQFFAEMGVVIQEYLEADYAGVTFTQSPYDDLAYYTEYVQGAGEALMAGMVTPHNFSLRHQEPLTQSLPFNGKLLVEQSKMLQEKFGCHLDIEWVAVADEIYFVQARPITTKRTSRVYWSNTNLNENYPDPISPLLYSVARDSYYYYFKNLANLLQLNPDAIRSLEYDFSNTVGIWSNRIYYNMTSIHNILSASPLKAYFKEAFNQFVGYGNKKDASTLSLSPKTSIVKTVCRLIVLNLNLERHVRSIEKKVSDYSASVDQSTDFRSRSTLFYEFLDLRFHQWYHASLADLFSMVHYKWLGRITQKFYGELNVGAHNVLVQAIPGLISSEPLNAIWELVEHINRQEGGRELFTAQNAEAVYNKVFTSTKWESTKVLIQAYLKKWGFRCSGELMFLKENYIENPVKFIELVQSYMRNSAQNPRLVIAQKETESRQAMRKLAAQIFLKRKFLFPLSFFETVKTYLVAGLCKQAISSRERVRYKQAEMYYKFKVTVRSIGQDMVQKGWLDQAEDIFFLHYKEIGELISSSSMFGTDLKSLVASRMNTFHNTSKLVFPENFSTNFGDRPLKVGAIVELNREGAEFYGLPASGGRVKAKVKVLKNVLEGEKIERGDILVTKQTDPGWGILFPLIGGLIVERGGALSHGAIVAREFGIPAVIGIENITAMVKDGDEVILDGDLGMIQLLKNDDQKLSGN